MRAIVVNFFTFLRIPFSLVCLYYVLQGEVKLALAWYIAALLTDLFDGLIAIILGVRTKFGELFDPFCDLIMVLAGGLGLVLTAEGRYPWMIFFGIIAGMIIYVAVLALPVKYSRQLGCFSETLFYKVLSFCYPLSYVAVAVGILCVYIIKALDGYAYAGLVSVVIIMVSVAKYKRGRIAEWYAPVKEHIAR